MEKLSKVVKNLTGEFGMLVGVYEKDTSENGMKMFFERWIIQEMDANKVEVDYENG